MGEQVAEANTTGKPIEVKKGRRSRWRRVVGWTAGTIGALLVIVIVVINITPWPGAMLIRSIFESGAGDVKVAMEAYAPQGGVETIADQQYRSGDSDAYLDVYFPESAANTDAQLPTLIWTHGGAWISGDKTDAAPYFQIIANEGYTVISLGYSIAPEHEYPRPIIQVNEALAYIQENADRFHVDTGRLVMAGDSAGAQITSQVAAIVTNPDFATEMGITPALSPDQLRGVILFCGIYDMDAFMGKATVTSGLLQWGTKTAIWAYTGTRDTDSSDLQQMSTINHVTAAFPPAFISGGNADPLTDHQSRPLADRLIGLGVDVTSLFYPADHEPELKHEYQFDLDNADGQQALQDVLAFLRARTA
jgi:acetyl esterase/lipase